MFRSCTWTSELLNSQAAVVGSTGGGGSVGVAPNGKRSQQAMLVPSWECKTIDRLRTEFGPTTRRQTRVTWSRKKENTKTDGIVNKWHERARRQHAMFIRHFTQSKRYSLTDIISKGIPTINIPAGFVNESPSFGLYFSPVKLQPPPVLA